MNFIQDKYPLKIAQQLGIGNEDLAKLIIYLQFRDGGVSPRLFRDDRHRQELLNSFGWRRSKTSKRSRERGQEKKRRGSYPM